MRNEGQPDILKFCNNLQQFPRYFKEVCNFIYVNFENMLYVHTLDENIPA